MTTEKTTSRPTNERLREVRQVILEDGDGVGVMDGRRFDAMVERVARYVDEEVMAGLVIAQELVQRLEDTFERD